MKPVPLPRIGALLLALTACSEPDEILAPLAELCGVEGPVRLLELAPDQAAVHPPRRIGERLIYEIDSPLPDPDSVPYFASVDRQLWTSGTCGEAPTRVDERYSRVFEIERWPGLALACDDYGNIVSLARSGSLAPNVVFRSSGCDPIWSARGPISRQGDQQLLLHPYPDDPRSETAPTIVLPGSFENSGYLPRVAVADEELLALRPTGALESVDLRDNTVTLVQPGVGAFVASPSGRYYLWTPGAEAGAGSPALLQDRETGAGLYLGDVDLAANGQSLTFAEQGLVFLSLPTGEWRIFHLPDLQFITVPTGYGLARTSQSDIAGPRADGQWIVSARDSSLHTLDLGTGIVTPMFPRPGQVLAREAGGTLVLAVGECCDLGRADEEGAVWFIPDDDAPPTRIAARSTLFGWRPRADSMITLVDIHHNQRGRLVRVVTGTQTEQLVDDHVFAAFMEDTSDPDIVRYSVHDGERSGVWQVRLP